MLSDSEILVTPPPYSSHSTCAPLPGNGVYAGENATNDICQVQVVVHGAAGASATAPILAPFEGAPTFEQDGALQAPPGCGCEVYPAPTEFDYAPAPTITLGLDLRGRGSLASETGETLVTIHGSGLSRFTFDYAFFGKPGLEASVDREIAFQSGTEIQILAPADRRIRRNGQRRSDERPAVGAHARRRLGADAGALRGVPNVSGIANTASGVRLNGMSGAADTGGTPIQISGEGMLGQVTVVRFDDSQSPPSEGTDHSFERHRRHAAEHGDGLAEPGDRRRAGVHGHRLQRHVGRRPSVPVPARPAAVESLKPHSGPASGGTAVAIHGENLGCRSRSRSGAEAESFTPVRHCSRAARPARWTRSRGGNAKTKVPVTVTTAESYFTGSGDAPSSALFAYTGP